VLRMRTGVVYPEGKLGKRALCRIHGTKAEMFYIVVNEKRISASGRVGGKNAGEDGVEKCHGVARLKQPSFL